MDHTGKEKAVRFRVKRVGAQHCGHVGKAAHHGHQFLSQRLHFQTSFLEKHLKMAQLPGPSPNSAMWKKLSPGFSKGATLATAAIWGVNGRLEDRWSLCSTAFQVNKRWAGWSLITP